MNNNKNYKLQVTNSLRHNSNVGNTSPAGK